MFHRQTKLKNVDEIHLCGECAYVTEVTEHHTISLKGKPTLGECPFWTKSRRLLLSQKSCNEFKKK